jgi:hypothetical protein
MGTIAHKDLTGADLHVNKGFSLDFVNGDLSTGVLTVTHNLNKQFVGSVVVTDNNGKTVLPDDVDFTGVNALTVDLVSKGTITGTWHVEVVY